MNRQSITAAAKRALVASGLVARARCRSPSEPALRVLNYHSVSVAADYCKAAIAISPQLFDAHLTLLAKHYQVISIDEGINCLIHGDPWPERAVCITFDDGYADNYLVAYPMLRRHGLTATFFVVSDVVLERRAFWVGWLQRAIARSSPTRAAAALAISIPSSSNYEGHCQALADCLSLRINVMSNAERDAYLKEIARALAIPPPDAAPSDFMMTLAQLRELYAGGMSIGSHSMTHPLLTSLTPQEMEREMRDSKRQLEATLQIELRHFAHPNGLGPCNFSALTARTARELGYDSASTSERGVVRSGDDPFMLRRHSLDDQMVPAAFAFKLEEHQFPYLLFAS